MTVIDPLGLLLFTPILWNVLSIENVGYLSVLTNHVVFLVWIRLVSAVRLHEHVTVVSVFVGCAVLIWYRTKARHWWRLNTGHFVMVWASCVCLLNLISYKVRILKLGLGMGYLLADPLKPRRCLNIAFGSRTADTLIDAVWLAVIILVVYVVLSAHLDLSFLN